MEGAERSWEVDISLIDVCIKCNRGGSLLSCFSESCPLAIHESCLGFPARYDDNGHFHCPYCVYKKTVAELRRAERIALSCKKDLAMFLRGKKVEDLEPSENNVQDKGSDPHNQAEYNAENLKGASCDEGKGRLHGESSSEEPSDKKKRSHNNFDEKVHGDEPGTSAACLVRPNSGGVNGNRQNLEEKQKLGGKEEKTTSAFGVPHPPDEEIEDVSSSESQDHVHEEQNISTALVVYNGKGGSKRDHVKKSDESARFRRKSGRKSADVAKEKILKYADETSTSTKVPQKHCDTSDDGNIVEWQPLKRRRTKWIPWEPKEIDMLKRGVEQFGYEKKIPWGRILKLGIGVFNMQRVPSDLKVQWSNLCRRGKIRASNSFPEPINWVVTSEKC